MEAIAPQVVFYLFGLPITDTVVSTWVMMVMLIIIALIIRKYAPHIGEFIIEMINSIVSSVMPEDVRVIQFLPFLGTLALFLVLGIFSASSHSWCPPLPTSTQPLPCHCWSFFAVHYFGIREKGLWGYIKDTASPIFVFPLEVISQLSRTLSLTIRLFGNVLSTDLVVAIIFSLIPFIVPLPLAALGMLTGVLQAYIFTVLASLYIASAIEIANVEEERRQMKQELKKS